MWIYNCTRLLAIEMSHIAPINFGGVEMTAWEIAEEEMPNLRQEGLIYNHCPSDFGILPNPDYCLCCEDCWEREVEA